MNKFYYLFSFILLMNALFFRVNAQTAHLSDSAAYAQAINQTLELYRLATGPQTSIYKGKVFTEYKMHIDGHQYFESDVWENGSVDYDGLLYDNLRMKYDVANAVVLIDHAQIAYPVKLETEKVSSFSLLGHHFIRIEKDSLHATLPNTGFYDLLYEGKVDFLAARIKTLKDQIENHRVNYWFKTATKFYIKKDAIYYIVKSKRSVLKVLADRKKVTKKFIRENKLKFGENTEEAILKTVVYYNQLLQP